MSCGVRGLMVAALVLSAIGVVAIYSSTMERGATLAFKQMTWIGIGLMVMFLVSRIRIKTLSAFAYLIYVGSIILLVGVLLVGTGPQDTRRWFDLGFFRFQPSEVAKLATVLCLARLLSETRNPGQTIRGILKVFAVVGLPAALILNQPDLGTALVISFLAFPMLYACGLDGLYLFFLMSPFLALICASEVVAWIVFIGFLVLVMLVGKFKASFVAFIFSINFLLGSLAPRLWMSLAPYQRQRVLAFLKPQQYRYGAGFQIIQSKIAIGSGGLTGKGIFKGTQKALGLVPAQHTDFIYSVIGEEMGFLGCMLVLGLLLYLILRLFSIGNMIRGRFAYLVTFGIASLILIQSFINIGMNLGLTPVTGLPLPFMSYGGSSTIVFWGAIGIVISCYLSRKEY